MSSRNESALIRRERCPLCAKKGLDRSGNNLAVYDDGHKYCYAGCGMVEYASNYQRLKGTLHAQTKKVDQGSSFLPWDVTKTLDMRALLWLSQYEIARDEIVKYGLMWSPQKQFLIFPFTSDMGQVIAFQARCFDPNGPKYYTKGPVDAIVPLDLTEHKEDGIILVEDMVSGMKIQRQYNCFPLLGSYVSPHQLTRLKHFTKRLTFWLDYDKRAEAVKLAQRAQSVGFSASIIVTEFDPKAYSDSDIYEIVSNSRKEEQTT